MARRRLSFVDLDQYDVSQIQDVYPGAIYLSQIKYNLWTQKILTHFSAEGLAPNLWKICTNFLEECDLLWIESVFVGDSALRKVFIPFTIWV